MAACPSSNQGARNVVLVYGLFADGSCWSGSNPSIAEGGAQRNGGAKPIDNVFLKQSLQLERVLARQDGPTVLVGHSFSGMIVTEAGVHPNVSALVYVAARAPDAG